MSLKLFGPELPRSHKSKIRQAAIAEVMERDIEKAIKVLETEFKNIKSPDPAKLIQNEKESLKAFLYGVPVPGKINKERTHFVFNHVAEFILKGKKRIFKKSEVGGSFDIFYRRWTIEAEAKYKLLEWLESFPSDTELKSFCLFLHHRSGFIAPAKNDAKKWNLILEEFKFVKFSPLSIGKTFNELSSTSNKKGLEPKHYLQAEKLFNLFPDKIGLKSLLKSKESKS